ncbi:MAG: AsmA-like C-terminal region-containing protein, partial [Burkholderiales bacterium]|nr:AsmA-like C-terminal region-containing protein [Burkholderiales bacterium]
GTPAGGQSKIDLQVGVLDLFGKRLRQVEVRAGSDAGGWSADVVAAELEGNLAYRSEGDGLLVARLKRFRVPEDAPGAAGTAARGEVRRALPAVDLIAERFEVAGRELGRAEIGARTVKGAWEIDKLVVLNPHGELRGKGTRKLDEGNARTSLAFSLRVSDVGRYLARVGYPDMVDGGRARVDGSLAWQGEPQRIDYPTLEGDLKLSVEDGQFLEMDPGLGKLVGLISLQALPKRITLDFRDVFSAGFKFDRISSSIETRRGVMSTQDFEMRGPTAEVDMRGRTDLAAETQDLHVKIVPSVSDTASAAMAIVNPAVGAAALLAQRALKNPLGQMLAFEYAITGSWSDPQVKKLGVQPSDGGAFTEKP